MEEELIWSEHIVSYTETLVEYRTGKFTWDWITEGLD